MSPDDVSAGAHTPVLVNECGRPGSGITIYAAKEEQLVSKLPEEDRSFYLDPANPKGCTSCFCFGVNNHCHSTHKRRAKVCKELESFWIYLLFPNEEEMNWHET